MPRSFYAVAVGFATGVAMGTLHALTWSGIAACALVGACLCLFRSRVPYVFVFGVFLLAAACGAGRARLVSQEVPAAFVPLIGTHAHLVGTLVAMPDVRETSEHLTLGVQQGSASTRVLVTLPPHAGIFAIGDRLDASGTLSQPQPFASDGGRVFRYDQFLAKDGIFLVMQPASVRVIGRSTDAWLSFLRVLQRVHDFFVSATERALPEPESALSIGIIAGGKQGLGPRLLAAFTASGLLQIVVLSGYNVMIVAEGLLRLLARLPRRIAFAGACGGIVSFVLAAGAGSSAVRAGIMAIIALVARATGRTYDVLRALFLALIAMLLWNPLILVYDPGLQLSFLATLGLILGVPHVERHLLWIRSAFVRDLLATTLAAQIAVLPMLLYQSGNLSLVSIPANALTMPVVPAAMAAGTLAAGCGMLFVPSFVATACGVPAYALLAYVLAVATYAAALPFARFVLPAFPFWIAAVAYTLLGALLVRAASTPPARSAPPPRSN